MDVIDYLLKKYDAATLKPSQFARELSCHPSHVRAMLADGTIKGVKVGSRWLIPVGEAAAILGGERHVGQ